MACLGKKKHRSTRGRSEPVDTQATDKKAHYIDLFDEIADMTDPISSDLALFLFCMLN